MKFSFDRQAEELWLGHYKAHKDSNNSNELFQLAKAGAQAARDVQLDLLDATGSRQQRFTRIAEAVRSLIKRISCQMKRPDHAEWLRGYFCFHTQDVTNGRRHYYSAATASLQENADFLADLGRFEYNAGHVLCAREIFEKLFPIRELLSVQPLQTYRWLAKIYRHLRQFDKEIAILEDLREVCASASCGPPAAADPEDLRLSRELVNRLPQALNDAGRPQEALAFVNDGLRVAGSLSVDLARQGVVALLALGKEQEADDWAGEWAVKLSAPALLTDFFQHSRHPFSAMKKKEDILAQLSLEKSGEKETILFFSDNFDINETCTGETKAIYDEAARCFSHGFHQEGAEAAFQLAERIFATGESPTLLASAMACITEHLALIPITRKLEALFTEAKGRFCDNATVLAQYGRYLLFHKRYEEALAVLKDAWEKDASRAPLFPVLLGKAYAGLGEERLAAEWIEKAVKGCSGADLVVAYMYAVELASESDRHFDVLRWHGCFLKDFVQAKGFPDADLGAQHFPRNQYVQRIFRLAGQAAIGIKDYDKAVECFEHLLANHGTLLFFTTRNTEGPFSYRVFADASLLLALAHCLAQERERAGRLCAQTKELDPENPLLPVVEALILAADGRVAEAITHLQSVQVEEWIFPLVGDYILDMASVAGYEGADLGAFIARVRIATGEVPTHAELFNRLESQSRQLAEAEERSRSLQQTFSSLKQAMNSLVERVPLPEEVRAIRKRAINEGTGIEDFIDQCVKHLVTQNHKDKEKDGQGRYAQCIPINAWSRLDKKIQERIVAAERYVVAVKENDFGPALVTLASALEILLKEKLVQPMATDIRKTFPRPDLETSADLRSGSLGTIPHLLAAKGQYSTQYKTFVKEWVEAAFPEHSNYVLVVLPDLVSKISISRNGWAHGGEGVGYERFMEIEKFLFDADYGVLLRMA